MYKYNYVFWFIYNLIIFTIITPLINFLLSRKWLGCLTLVAVLLAPIFLGDVLTNVGIDLNFLIFYVIGCFIGKYYFKIAAKKSNSKIAILGLVLCLICIGLKMLTIYQVIALPFVAQQILLIIFCMATWVTVDIFIEKFKVTDFTKESFLIYALHPYIIAIVVKIIYLIFPHTSWMMCLNFIVSYLATIVILRIVISLWHKYLPQSYTICSGRLKLK